MTLPMRSSTGGLFARLAAAPRASLLLGLLLLASLLGAAPAAAQGFGWFGNLFGGFPRPNQGAPSYPGTDGYAPRQPSDPSYARPRRRVVRRPAEPAQREAAKAPPKNASLFVAVLGDSLGQMLGQGLDEALADRADVAVVQKARPSSGLVGGDGTDWSKTVAELLDGKAGDVKGSESKSTDSKSTDVKSAGAKGADRPGDGKPARPAREKIDVAVMMIGVNDHQPLTVDGRVLQPGTAEWTAVYAKRVTAIDEAFRAHGVPLIWVGVPIAKDDAFADAMAGLNDVYREAAAKTGATYIDTWEAFSDDNGNFAAYGPDVNGQTVRLRAADGIHFTKAGARKLAHFVETQVRRALEGKAPLPLLPTESADGKSGEGKVGEGKPGDGKSGDGKTGDGRQLIAAHPDVGPIRNLNEAPLAANGALAAVRLPPPAGDIGEAKGDAKGDTKDDAARPTLTAGDGAPPGRADNARWSGDASGAP